MVRVEFEGHRFVLSNFLHFVKLHPCKTLLRISVHTQLTGRRDADGRIFCPPMTTKQCQRKTDRRDGIGRSDGWTMMMGQNFRQKASTVSLSEGKSPSLTSFFLNGSPARFTASLPSSVPIWRPSLSHESPTVETHLFRSRSTFSAPREK